MPELSASKKFASATILLDSPRWVGVAVTLFGLVIIASWYAHWTDIIQVFPNASPVQYNTALCFVFCGSGLFCLTTRRAGFSVWLGGAVALFTLLTLLEYLTGGNFGIDQLFLKPYFQLVGTYPGRMSPLTASCFLLFGTALGLTGIKRRWPLRLAIIGLIAVLVATIAFVSLFGYFAGIRPAYNGWGAYSRMAINTAVSFIALGGGLFIWGWQKGRQQHFNFLRWVPATAAVTLMVMVAIISSVSLTQLKESLFWRQHTYEVLMKSSSLLGGLTDMQRGMRGYVLTDNPEMLQTFASGTNSISACLAQLNELTRDNPVQQHRLKEMSAAFTSVFDYARRLIDTRNHSGLAAAAQLEVTGEGKAEVDRLRDMIKDFDGEEQRLLADRDRSSQLNLHNTSTLLVSSSVLAALLLVLANSMASREIARRRRVELQLGETLTLQNAILGSASYAITALDPRGFVRSFNSAAERMLGYTADEVVGKVTPLLWRDPKEVEARAEQLSRELGRPIRPGIEIITSKPANTKAEEYEATFIRKDGSRFPALISLSALTDASGTVTGFLGVIADITNRKKAEAALRVSQERFRSAFDGAPIGMSLVSPQGRWLKVNHALCDMLGYSEVELLETDFQHITHSDDLAKDLELLQQVLAGKILSYQIEKRYLHKNGSHISAMLSVSLVHDRLGDPLYFVAQIENITERKKAEAEREKLIAELQDALAEVKTLSGMIPICGWCKKVRTDEGYLQSIEQYVRAHSDATFSHGMCPDCARKFEADVRKANQPDVSSPSI